MTMNSQCRYRSTHSNRMRPRNSVRGNSKRILVQRRVSMDPSAPSSMLSPLSSPLRTPCSQKYNNRDTNDNHNRTDHLCSSLSLPPARKRKNDDVDLSSSYDESSRHDTFKDENMKPPSSPPSTPIDQIIPSNHWFVASSPPRPEFGAASTLLRKSSLHSFSVSSSAETKYSYILDHEDEKEHHQSPHSSSTNDGFIELNPSPDLMIPNLSNCFGDTAGTRIKNVVASDSSDDAITVGSISSYNMVNNHLAWNHSIDNYSFEDSSFLSNDLPPRRRTVFHQRQTRGYNKRARKLHRIFDEDRMR